MEPMEVWLWTDLLCFGIRNCYLSHLSLSVVNCQNMTDVRNVKQAKALPLATLPGILLEASVPVTCC